MGNELRSVAFVGLGKMGSAMAANVLRAGFDVVVYNRTREKMQPLVQQGAEAAKTPRAAAESADAVITNLMDDASVRAVVDGPDGVAAGLAAGKVHIGTTTNSPALATELVALHARRGGHYVAAPVLGRPDAAAAKRLVALVGGDRQIVDRCEPLLGAFTTTVTYVGPEPRMANSAKLALNYFVVSFIDLIGEVYALAERSDVSPDLMLAFFRAVIAHPGLQAYAAQIRARDFGDAGFELKGGLKDVELILQAATVAGVPLPHATVVRQKFQEAIGAGLAAMDWSAVTEVTRAHADLASKCKP
jgi:3-hydroxyisobutyrate dehydrogenase-like beta-hydroxyacid dehydrogenase